MGQINFPDAQYITDVIRERTPDPAEYIGLSMVPLDTKKQDNSPRVITWDIKGPVTGMTHASVLGSNPQMVKHTTLKTKAMKTAYWKEFKRLDEDDLLHLRGLGPDDRTRAAAELIADSVMILETRLETRMEWLVWQMFHGTLTLNERGVIRVIDYEIPAGNKINASVNWSTTGTSDPILDIQNIAKLASDYGTEIDTIYINHQQATWLANSTKVRDLVKTSSEVVNIGVGNVGELIFTLAGVPGKFVIYDKGYLNDSGTFTRFIANEKVVVKLKNLPQLGKFASFRSTPSLYNGGVANATGGKFYRAKDMTDDIHKPHYDMLMGIYGLPVMFHPEWVVVLTVHA